MNKRILLFLFLASLVTVSLPKPTTAASPQILSPARWTFKAEERSDGDFDLVFHVKIEEEWHVYSQYTDDGGPLPMVFSFDPSPCYSRSGKVTEPKPINLFDSTFGVNTKLFKKEATFTQRVKLRDNSCTISGRIEYQACKEVCIFMDSVFTINVSRSKGEKPAVVIDTVAASPAADTPKAEIAQATITPEGGDDSGLEPGCGDGKAPKPVHSLLGILLAGMLGGLLALLTPCVFPMIPMTVSFFTKRSGSRRKGITNAIIYAISIILIYVSLGLLVTITMGSDALNELSSNAFFNLSFFIIFIIFAISFFGAFEITLPSWIINKADEASDRGGLIGIFFMAFTLSLVSFSCTGPIIGTLLVEAAQGQSYLGPLAGMTGFAFALAVPFALFALFPGWLNSLPKSGGWLNTIKVTLGFIELALAFKFLSNVDLAYDWGILKREVFISIWVIITLLLGFYLLGKIRLSHDSDLPYVSPGRLIIAMLVFTFAIYMIPGIWGAPLKLISGFPPPDFYKEWTTGEETECPHNLNCFHDYEEGMRYAKTEGKPVMLDFTGWTCVNCRKMEDNVWSDPEVLKRLRDDYVVISLYVDDKSLLPEAERTVTPSGKQIRSVGNKWSYFQSSVYGTNSQPYYVLIDNKAKILAEPMGGIIGTSDYLAFLDEGLCRYQLRN